MTVRPLKSPNLRPLKLVTKTSNPNYRTPTELLILFIKLYVFPYYLLYKLITEIPVVLVFALLSSIDFWYDDLKQNYRYLKSLNKRKVRDLIKKGVNYSLVLLIHKFYIRNGAKSVIKLAVKFIYENWIRLDVVLDEIVNLPNTITQFFKDATRSNDYYEDLEYPQISFSQTFAERPSQSREELMDNYFTNFDAVTIEDLDYTR